MAARYVEWELLEDAEYVPMDGVSRCLHLDDFDHCWRKKALIPHKLFGKLGHTDRVGKILWFSPSVETDDHNKYGNVAFDISMRDLLSEFDFNIYYIDRLEFPTHVCTRLLFTEKDYYEFDCVEFAARGSPLKRNRWRYAATDDGIPHQVEIAIETDAEGRRWLFDKCSYSAVDHSCANARKSRKGGYKPNICHRYNLFGKQCPFAYSANTTQRELDTRYYSSDTEGDEY